ncbi:MAG: hypothetical protein HQL58_03245 [Magnetococcales bacterium]|nr:hypothetical protein [Magnetococcales bacterium]
MRQKQLGLISVTLLLGSWIATAGYFGWQHNLSDQTRKMAQLRLRQQEQSKPDAANKRPEIPAIDASIRDIIARLQPRMRELRQPRQESAEPIKMEMLGFSDQALMQEMVAAKATVDQFKAQVIISMTFLSGDYRMAVINGRLYREGETLEGSNHAQIHTITPDKVLLASRDMRQWIEVSNSASVITSNKDTATNAAPQQDKTSQQPAQGSGAAAPASAANTVEDIKKAQSAVSDVLKELKGGR